MVVCETPRLRLRYLTPDDAPFIVELLNEPSFIANVADRGVRTAEDARAYIEAGPRASYERHGFGLYLVELADSRDPIGICGLLRRDTLDAPDVGFAFLPAHWSKGYARESAGAVMRLARDRFGIERIVAITAPHNTASMKVLEALGFARVGEVTSAETGRSVLFSHARPPSDTAAYA